MPAQTFATAVVSITLVAGCVSHIDPNVPEPIRSFTEPAHESVYLLYRPSSYDRNYEWPLVIACHSAFPDSPPRQIRDWTQLAEREGFLVAVPTLSGVRKSFAPNPEKQRPLQLADEARILAVIRHIRAGHSISDDRVFLYGFGGGAHAALFTGLRHPTIFRAIALLQPAFNPGFLSANDVRVSPYQPIHVDYNVTDSILGKHGKRCVEWLRLQHAETTDDPSGTAAREQVDRAVAFFEGVIRKTAWMHVSVLASATDNPLERRFQLRCIPKPTSVHWSFGDGDKSAVAEPIHLYAHPGTYRVEVTAGFEDRDTDTRSVSLTVPQGIVTPARSADD